MSDPAGPDPLAGGGLTGRVGDGLAGGRDGDGDVEGEGDGLGDGEADEAGKAPV